MKYFKISQDKLIDDIISFSDFKTDEHAILLKEQANSFNDVTTLFVEGNTDTIYPDFIENPVFLVSDELKKVFEMYDETLIFKTVILANLEAQTQHIYWLVLTDIIDALSDKTEFYKNGWEKNIFINDEKVDRRKIFQIKGLRKNQLIIHLDVAESILRREFNGIDFEEVGTEKEGVV